MVQAWLKRSLIGMAALGLVLAAGPAPVQADDPPSLSCVVGGMVVPPGDTLIHSGPTGDKAIAKLTGARVPITIQHFPNPPKGRLRLATTTGGAVRIDGWAAMDAVPLYATRDLPIVGTHVWLTEGQPLTLVQAKSDGFDVEHTIIGSSGQKLTFTLPCDGATLTIPDTPSVEVPDKARTYQMKKESIDLYDKPSGKVVLSLSMAEDARKVFWSTESRGGFVHVAARSDITIDAWARWADLVPLHHAEVFDLSTVTPRERSPKKLALQDPPKAVKATKGIPIHAKPANGTPIGEIEVGATFFPMQQSGDWTAIMPESLAVLAADGDFWVRTTSLPQDGD